MTLYLRCLCGQRHEAIQVFGLWILACPETPEGAIFAFDSRTLGIDHDDERRDVMRAISG